MDKEHIEMIKIIAIYIGSLVVSVVLLSITAKLLSYIW